MRRHAAPVVMRSPDYPDDKQRVGECQSTLRHAWRFDGMARYRRITCAEARAIHERWSVTLFDAFQKLTTAIHSALTVIATLSLWGTIAA